MHHRRPGKLKAVARARYEPGASVAQLKAFGFNPDTYKVTINAWDETWPIWQLWDRIGNQWRTGGDGAAIALDYNPLFHLLGRMNLDESEYDDLFDGVRCIESEVLTIWSELREAARKEAERKR